MSEIKDFLLEDDDPTIMLTLDDGSELECACLTVFEVENQEYIALYPLEDNEEDTVLLYRYHETSDDDWEVEYIEDDDEYEKICDFFDEMLDDEEYEENFAELD